MRLQAALNSFLLECLRYDCLLVTFRGTSLLQHPRIWKVPEDGRYLIHCQDYVEM